MYSHRDIPYIYIYYICIFNYYFIYIYLSIYLYIYNNHRDIYLVVTIYTCYRLTNKHSSLLLYIFIIYFIICYCIYYSRFHTFKSTSLLVSISMLIIMNFKILKSWFLFCFVSFVKRFAGQTLSLFVSWLFRWPNGLYIICILMLVHIYVYILLYY